MIEKDTLDFLNTRTRYPVYAEYPLDHKYVDNNFYVIDLIGSSYENHIATATIAIQSYGESKYQAAEMNERVKEVMYEMPGYSVRLRTDYYFADTRNKKYRYQAVYDITKLEGIKV